MVNRLLQMYGLSDAPEPDLFSDEGPSSNQPLAMVDGRRYRRAPVQPELRNAPERVWPNSLWWENNLGIKGGSTLDKYGQAQSVFYNALDALTLGLPRALALRYFPEEVKNADDISKSHRGASTAGAIFGAVSGPPGAALRAAGNALARRGYGIAPQAAADGGSGMAAFMAPSVVSGQGPGALDFRVGSDAATAAMALRATEGAVSNPFLRVGLAAGTGAMAGFPAMAIEGDWTRPLSTGLMGGALAAMTKSPQTSNQARRQAQDYAAGNLAGPGIVGAAATASHILGSKAPFPEPGTREWWEQNKTYGTPRATPPPDADGETDDGWIQRLIDMLDQM